MARGNFRPKVTIEQIESEIRHLERMLDKRIIKHGNGAFVSPHEILGVVDEEYDEFKEAVHDNVLGEAYAELVDIAVACVFACASIRYHLDDATRNA